MTLALVVPKVGLFERQKTNQNDGFWRNQRNKKNIHEPECTSHKTVPQNNLLQQFCIFFNRYHTIVDC
jgi:hypothetical protein